MSDDRLERGRETYARNFGIAPDEVQRVMESRAGGAYVAEAYVAAGGPGWAGDGLTDRDRAVAVIAALVAQGVTDDRMVVYLNLARRNGLDEAGLEQLMILLMAYLGQPVTSMAMAAVRASGEASPQGGVTPSVPLGESRPSLS